MKKIITGVVLFLLLIFVACKVTSDSSESVEEVPTEEVK